MTSENESTALTTYTCRLDSGQSVLLEDYLKESGCQVEPAPHARFQARRPGLSITLYQSGKLLIQGKETADFVQFVLEPRIVKMVRFGYERILDEFQGERIGVDESGKGDYFGPLVIAGVYVDKAGEDKLRRLKVRDSKKISDRRIQELRRIIRRDFVYSVVSIGPERYNQLYTTMKNMNRILAWGHARVIENLLGKVECGKAVLDQFGRKEVVLKVLMKQGRTIEVIQQFRGESDIAVAAASVLARGEFVAGLKRKSEEFETLLPLGNSKDKILSAAREVVEKWGIESLVKVAKVHFKTTKEVIVA